MAQIVDLKSYQNQQIERKAFGPWFKRFGEQYTASSCITDLSDPTLYQLALPGDISSTAFYELIMGAKKEGTSTKFHYLDDHEKMAVIDIHLFMADQVRFEMMYRLGWVETYPCQQISIASIILTFDRIKNSAMVKIPILAASHPAYHQFAVLAERDKESFIRKLLPDALDAFHTKISRT